MKGIEKFSYIEILRSKYRRSSIQERSLILDDICRQLRCHRKHATRLMCKRVSGRPKKPETRGRKGKYQNYEFITALKSIWRITYYMCGKNLNSAMQEWLPYVEQEYGDFKPDIKLKLLSISAATIDRILKPLKGIKAKSLTKPGSLLRDQIPVQGNIWDVQLPGFLEADTVAHCGGSLYGEFVYTLTCTDIATSWTEARAVFGKGSSGVLEQVKDVENSLPFPLRGFDSDCGSEFINQYLLNHFLGKKIQFTRSRPYHKNDNSHVEQKNWSLARRYLGYERLEFQELIPLINHYYKNVLCPLINHFHPCFKLKAKIQVKSKTRRIYDKPMTPYQRVINSPHVSEQHKVALREIHTKLNPVKLSLEEKRVRKLIDSTLKKLKLQRLNNNNLIFNKSRILLPTT